jgi:hypothetical protein
MKSLDRFWPIVRVQYFAPKRPHVVELSNWLCDRLWRDCLDFRLFRNFQRIINFDAKVSHCAFQLGVA